MNIIHLNFFPNDQVPISLSSLFFLVLGLRPGKLEELDASRANRVRPVNWTLCMRYTTSDLIKKVRGRYWAMKRRYKVRWKGVKSLDLHLAGERSVEENIRVPLRGTKHGQVAIHTPCHLHWTSSNYPSSSYSTIDSKRHVGCSERANGSFWGCEDRQRKAMRACSDYGGGEGDEVAQ